MALKQRALRFRIAGYVLPGGIVTSRVEWGEATDLTADALVGAEQGRRGPAPDRHDEAVQFLRDLLADGEVLATAAEGAAGDASIAARTLKRAKATLKVEVRKRTATGGGPCKRAKCAKWATTAGMATMPLRGARGLMGKPSALRFTGEPSWRPAQPCRAHRSNGEPCRNYAIHGGVVCRVHGGSAPQVRQAAERRWAEAQIERALAIDVPALLAQQAAEELARRERVAAVLGLDVRDPALGPWPTVSGWMAAAARLLSTPVVSGPHRHSIRWRARNEGEAHAFAPRQYRPLCGAPGWDERHDWPVADRPKHARCAELAGHHISPASSPDSPGAGEGRAGVACVARPPSRPQGPHRRETGRKATPNRGGPGSGPQRPSTARIGG